MTGPTRRLNWIFGSKRFAFIWEMQSRLGQNYCTVCRSMKRRSFVRSGKPWWWRFGQAVPLYPVWFHNTQVCIIIIIVRGSAMCECMLSVNVCWWSTRKNIMRLWINVHAVFSCIGIVVVNLTNTNMWLLLFYNIPD